MNNDFVTVPFYKEADGSKTHFLPNVRMSSGYRFGRKGSEQVLSDYWEALEALSKMAIPTFRRPNSAGNFGGVACKAGDVEEVSRKAILQQIEAVKLKIK